MNFSAPPIISPEQYLVLERSAEFKSEYVNREIRPCTSSNVAHNGITANIVATLHAQFRNRACRVYATTMRVKIADAVMYAYPDVFIIAGQSHSEDSLRDTLTNPVIIIEVVSPGTEAYDRGDKFAHYRRSDTLQEYLLVSQNKVRVEHFTRQEDNSWVLREYEGEATEVVFAAVECRLMLSDIYEEAFDDEQR